MPNSPDPALALSNSQSSVTPLAPASTGPSSSSGKSRFSSAKPSNIFSGDGSFLDRIRRSIKEEEDKKKALEILERLVIAVWIYPQESTSEAEGSPQKKQKISETESASKLHSEGKKEEEEVGEKIEGEKKEDDKKVTKNPQAEYHKALGSYSSSLKDSGAGVRPLVK